MAKTIPEIQQLVAGHVQDAAAKLSSDELKTAIEEALAGRYSKDRPRRLLADLTGDGAQYDWDLSAVTGWQDGFSQVVEIEYPQGERVPALLEQDDWMIYKSPTARFLRFRFALASGRVARVQFTAPHELDASSMPEADFYAVGALGASLAARRLEQDYENLLGTDPERTAPAASRTAPWKGETAGGDRLTH